MANWSPASSVLPQLFADVPSNPPALPPGTALGGVPGQKCHEVDYEILGDDMQIVAIELDHGERRQQRKRRGVGSWWTWELAGRGLANHHLDPLGWVMIPLSYFELQRTPFTSMVRNASTLKSSSCPSEV